MRAAHGLLLHLFAVVLAPYFVHFCDSWTALGYSRDRWGRMKSAAISFHASWRKMVFQPALPQSTEYSL